MSARPWAFQQGILWALELVPMRRPALAEPIHPAVSTGEVRAAGNAGVPRATSRGLAQFMEAGPDMLAPLARAMELGEPTELEQRFRNGRRCFVGCLDGEVVTYGWLSLQRESVGELERDYRLPPGEAYIWDCATLPAHRGAGLYGALLGHIVATLRSEGMQRAWIGANLENVPSLRAFARAGFQPVVRVIYARLLRARCMLLRAQPGAPAALVAGARAMLTEPYERAWHAAIIGLQPLPP